MGKCASSSKIEKMDINGLDRKLLCTFSGNILINDGAVVGDGRIILCATKLLSNAENIGTVPCLLSIDIGTGECSDLYQVKQEMAKCKNPYLYEEYPNLDSF